MKDLRDIELEYITGVFCQIIKSDSIKEIKYKL